MQGFAHLRHSDHLADLVGTQIVELLPGKMLLLDLLDHFFRNFLRTDVTNVWMNEGRKDEKANKRKTRLIRLMDEAGEWEQEGSHLELPKRRHGLPHPLVDHLAERETFVGQLSPGSMDDDFENGAHQPETWRRSVSANSIRSFRSYFSMY